MCSTRASFKVHVCVALQTPTNYRDTVLLFQTQALIGDCEDFRYVVTDVSRLTEVKRALDDVYESAVPKAQVMVLSLVALVRRLEGRLAFLHDWLRGSLFGKLFCYIHI